MFCLLKFSDEKYVTERAYENPKFIEDLIFVSSEADNAALGALDASTDLRKATSLPSSLEPSSGLRADDLSLLLELVH